MHDMYPGGPKAMKKWPFRQDHYHDLSSDFSSTIPGDYSFNVIPSHPTMLLVPSSYDLNPCKKLRDMNGQEMPPLDITKYSCT